MITHDQQGQASLYALGSLQQDERRAFEERLCHSVELQELVRGLETVAAQLALAAPPAKPAKDLRAKVLAAAAAAERPAATDASGLRTRPGFMFHGAADPAGWKQLPVRGAWIKLLSLEKASGYAVLLGKLEPGVRYPPHKHSGAEELYILTGDLHIGDRTLGPGDFHHSDAGTAHDVNYSAEGCTLLAVVPADHELVQFAMRE